jgi:hypothetical protein
MVDGIIGNGVCCTLGKVMKKLKPKKYLTLTDVLYNTIKKSGGLSEFDREDIMALVRDIIHAMHDNGYTR